MWIFLALVFDFRIAHQELTNDILLWIHFFSWSVNTEFWQPVLDSDILHNGKQLIFPACFHLGQKLSAFCHPITFLEAFYSYLALLTLGNNHIIAEFSAAPYPSKHVEISAEVNITHSITTLEELKSTIPLCAQSQKRIFQQQALLRPCWRYQVLARTTGGESI